jgi:DnaJ-class molecular chaperone
MAKSYYAILGVKPSATGDEIRSAYRRLAKEYHPDLYAGSGEIFREIQEAYHVLGDPLRRRRYERHISPVRAGRRPQRTVSPQPEPLIPEEGPVDIGEVSPVRSFQTFTPSVDEIFDWLWRNFSSMAPPKSARIENLTLEVLLNAEQAARGGNARVMIPARAICPTCRGRGAAGPYVCMRCAGEGETSGEVPVTIGFPPGLAKDHAVVVPLDRFGIHNLRLTVLFRPTGGDSI